MGGNGHDGAGAVAGEHIVGNPDGYPLSIDGVDSGDPQGNAGLLLRQVGSLEIAFGGTGFLVIRNGLPLSRGGDLLDKVMFRSKHQVSGSEESVRTRGEHRDAFLKTFERELHLGSLTPANPVALEQLDRFGPVEAVEILDQALRVGGDPEHPLSHRTTLDGESTHLALAVDHLFIGKDGSQTRTPVHGNIGDKGQADAIGIDTRVCGNRFSPVGGGIDPCIVELEENPLGPPEIAWIGRADLPRPVIAESQRLEL